MDETENVVAFRARNDQMWSEACDMIKRFIRDDPIGKLAVEHLVSPPSGTMRDIKRLMDTKDGVREFVIAMALTAVREILCRLDEKQQNVE